MTTWLGLNAGHEDRTTADTIAVSLYETLLFHAQLVCVHQVEGRHAMSFRLTEQPSENTVSTLIERGYGVAVHNGSLQRLAGPEELTRGALRAALAHRDRQEGRALRFPGQRTLRGRYGVRTSSRSARSRRSCRTARSAWTRAATCNRRSSTAGWCSSATRAQACGSARVRADGVLDLRAEAVRAARAVGAAEEPALHLDAVAEDAAVAVLAAGREALDRALEAVERVHPPPTVRTSKAIQ